MYGSNIQGRKKPPVRAVEYHSSLLIPAGVVIRSTIQMPASKKRTGNGKCEEKPIETYIFATIRIGKMGISLDKYCL
jgi:hypothetical protein